VTVASSHRLIHPQARCRLAKAAAATASGKRRHDFSRSTRRCPARPSPCREGLARRSSGVPDSILSEQAPSMNRIPGSLLSHSRSRLFDPSGALADDAKEGACERPAVSFMQDVAAPDPCRNCIACHQSEERSESKNYLRRPSRILRRAPAGRGSRSSRANPDASRFVRAPAAPDGAPGIAVKQNPPPEQIAPDRSAG